jgi:hypothetical protein
MPSQGIAPCSEGCVGKSGIPTQGTAPVQTSFRWMAACIVWRLGFRQSSFHHIPRVPQHPQPVRLGQATAFLACSCPLHLSDPGQPSDPGTSLRVPPGCTGDTTRRLAAHRICRRSRATQRHHEWTKPASGRADDSAVHIVTTSLPVVCRRTKSTHACTPSSRLHWRLIVTGSSPWIAVRRLRASRRTCRPCPARIADLRRRGRSTPASVPGT